jgi:hypothetical protein
MPEYITRLETSLVKAVELPEPEVKKDIEVMETYGEAKDNIKERNEAAAIDITMQDVKSSNVKQIGYDKNSKQLRVQFTNGGLFQYKEVPNEVNDELINAKSIGSYFSKNIRNVYSCVKLN